MKLKIHGGGHEVGRNAFLLETGKERIQMDAGLKVEGGEKPLPSGKLDSILLSHGHLDHCGTVPTHYPKTSPTVYSTVSTFDQAHLILKDNIKVTRLRGRPDVFNEKQLALMKKNEANITYGQTFETPSSQVEVYDAGHIPGSCMFVIETNGKRILYTGDFKTEPTRLVAGIKNIPKNIDALIMENTYSSREHPPRSETERSLLDIVEQTLANDGIALVPVFAIGRAAEILMVLNQSKRKFKIYLDGMAKAATEIYLAYPEFVRDPKALDAAIKNVYPLTNQEERRKALKEPCVIVSTSGMLEGGPMSGFIRTLYAREDCSLTLTGFQAPGTAGRYLQDTGRFVHEDVDLKLKMRMSFLDFSAHAGRAELFEFVQKINPGLVIPIHGDNCQRFATELKGRGFKAVAPKNGEEVEI